MDTSEAALSSFFASVDGPSSIPEEATYKCSKVPVHYALELPIPVVAKGSTVRYAFSTEAADISFGIYIRKTDQALQAPNDEVREAAVAAGDADAQEDAEESELLSSERVDSHLEPITGSFVVPNAPCIVLLCWENHYSWFKSKTLSYSVTVKPPSASQTVAGKKQRIKMELDNVKVDRSSAETRLLKIQKHRVEAQERLKVLQEELAATRASLASAEAEENVVNDRLVFRKRQEEGLKERLLLLEKGGNKTDASRAEA